MFGVSKQAYYKRIKTTEKQEIINQKVIEIVQNARKRQRKMGRDALFTLLRNNGMLIKKNKCYHITTDSKHFYYTSPNLLKETELKHAEQAILLTSKQIKDMRISRS